MTYFSFLTIFLGIPLAILLGLTWLDACRGRRLPLVLQTWSPAGAVLLHVLIAVIYTTPWDNYLVATGIWYYHPQRVTGVLLGWVPIEEYIFFILQSLLTGVWLLFLARRMKLSESPLAKQVRLRLGSVLLLGFFVMLGIAILGVGWQQGAYLALILVWALPPIMIQIAWGGHILWQYRRLVLASLISATLYLSAADSLAIGSGVWTIDPQQSTAIFLFGVLPLEEFVFFLATNTLLIFGIILALARPSLEQLAALRQKVKASTDSINATD